jgi:hypothetical protein
MCWASRLDIAVCSVRRGASSSAVGRPFASGHAAGEHVGGHDHVAERLALDRVRVS